jgi:hypothetical protein
MFKELRERLRYLVDRAFAREFAGQLMLFFVLVVIVTIIGMTAALFGLFSADNAAVAGIPRKIDQGFWDSLWWSLNQVLRLRGFERMYGASGAILAYALFLSIAGLAVFGILVSLINTTMRRRIEALRVGETPVKERGHVLILGWNNKITNVLMQLSRLERNPRVVILAPEEIPKMEAKLRVSGIQGEPVTTILRSGTPSHLRELDRVAIDHASSIIVLSSDDEDRDSMKTLVLLAAKTDWPGKVPTLTAEINKEHNYELAQIAAKDKVEIVSSSRVISKVIVQTIRHPGLAAVFSELLSDTGNSLYVGSVPDTPDCELGDLAYSYADAIPIGVAWKEGSGDEARHAVGLNPGADYEVAEDEQLVLLARRKQLTWRGAVGGYESPIYREGGEQPRVPGTVLIIGWNDELYDILMELDAHAISGTGVTLLSTIREEDAAERIDLRVCGGLKNLRLKFVSGDAAEPAVYQKIELNAFRSIVILADDLDGKVDADTRSLRVLLRLSHVRQPGDSETHMMVELLDAANRDLLTGLEVDDVIVSPDVVSSQLAQISRQKILGPIFRELLSAGGVEISLRPAGDYVELGVECCFDDLTYAALQKMEIALGLRFAESGEVLLNPDRDRSWRLSENDRVIVLAQQIYT